TEPAVAGRTDPWRRRGRQGRDLRTHRGRRRARCRRAGGLLRTRGTAAHLPPGRRAGRGPGGRRVRPRPLRQGNHRRPRRRSGRDTAGSSLMSATQQSNDARPGSDAGPATVDSGARWTRRLAETPEIGVVAACVVVFAGIFLARNSFVTLANLQEMGRNLSEVRLLALGESLVIPTGGLRPCGGAPGRLPRRCWS